MTQPRLIARLQITNGDGTFDSRPTDVAEDDIRIEWDVRKSLEQTPNTAVIKVYNLSPQRIEQIQGVVVSRTEWTLEEREALRQAGASTQPIETTYDNAGIASVVLSWGYRGATAITPFPPLSVGFIGGSYSMEVEDDGETQILVIEAEDAGQLLTAARLNKSYSNGADTVNIVVDLINACGLSVDEAQLRNLMGSSVLRRGFPIGKLRQIGGYNASKVPAADQLRKIFRSLDLRWSVQDGRFLLLDRDSVIPGLPPIVLSAARDTLWNNPSRQQAELMAAETWCNAEIRPGRVIQIEATNLSTSYRIERVQHTGDTEEGGKSVPLLDALQTIEGVF
jgi:hypothetical protein